MFNLKEQDREIEVTDKNGKKIKGNILFHYEDAGYNLVFYVIQDMVYVAKVNEDSSLVDLEEDEYNIAENILEEYFAENEIIDEEEDVELGFTSESKEESK